MLANKEIILTYEGLEKLEKELEFLKEVKRNEIAEKIKQARDFGDLSENAEYDEAKNEQGHVEVRIVQLENMLKHARVIDEDDIDTVAVSVGSKVILQDMQEGDTIEYTIVGSTEANPKAGKISNESPVGSALVGKSIGQEVNITVPDGVITFKILE
ncbi:MAG: transcription elongation factor GreA, partial [Hyphomonadaceae bacterium]|nr:transcription elongation factor GreA [Clostridia bacterium]